VELPVHTYMNFHWILLDIRRNKSKPLILEYRILLKLKYLILFCLIYHVMYHYVMNYEVNTSVPLGADDRM
jgi:hypothetical protein